MPRDRLSLGSLRYHGRYEGRPPLHNEPIEFLVAAQPAPLQSPDHDSVNLEIIQRVHRGGFSYDYHMDTMIYLSKQDALQLARKLHDEAVQLRDVG